MRDGSVESAAHDAGAAHHDGDEPGQQVFRSTLAGTWYPAEEAALARELDVCFSRVPDRSREPVCGLILPHAGYQWSGPTAAHGIQLLQRGGCDRIVVMGPSHRVRMPNQASLPDESHYATPLGELPLDQALIAQLKQHPVFRGTSQAQHGEHSVQIEIPLLQQALGHFRLVPIVVGQLDGDTVRQMADVLRSCLDSRTLVVASSDFTHYG